MSDLVKRGVDTPVNALNNLLRAHQTQIERALPKHLRPERLIRLAVTAMTVTPSLQDCSQLSIVNSVMLAASLGLEINNGLGHGWLIPYKRVCTFQPGYRGFLDLVYRTNTLNDANAFLIYENEPLEYVEGANPKFNHIALRPKDRGPEWIGAYSRLTKMNGFQSVHWMWREEIEAIRDKCSQAANKREDKWGNPIVPIWEKWFEEMVKKTVLKRHLKLSQMSHEIGLAVGIDDQAEAHAATSPESKKDRLEPVQDMMLDGQILDDARAADDALAAGSREEQQAVAAKKLEAK